MGRKALFAQFLLASSLLAQSTSVYIYDSNGNQANGTISNGNIYFHDSNGNDAFGTIKNGNVFLSTSKGEITFGTIKNGNVFLTDQKGLTTGTIHNGNIFLNNSDGSVTTGTYDGYGHVYTSTTGAAPSATQPQGVHQQENTDQQKQLQQQNYEEGVAAGRAIGSAIAAGVENHRVNSYCKSNPTSAYHSSDGISIQCPKAPLDSGEQEQLAAYCTDHPGSWMEFGNHKEYCATPPSPPNLKWAQFEMNSWQSDYRNQSKREVIAMSLSADQIRSNWDYWRVVVCSLAQPDTTYKDLNGKKQHCH